MNSLGPDIVKEEKKSNQIRALSRKTLTFQKRQCWTNCCCVACCPFLMVAICGILSIVLTSLIAGLNEVNYYTYCSNSNSTDLFTGIPLTKNSKSISYETFEDEKGEKQKRYLVNAFETSFCVDRLSNDYPFRFPYTPGPIINNCSLTYNPLLCPDSLISTTIPQPLHGWLQDLISIPNVASITFANLFANQINFWGWVSSSSSSSSNINTKIGSLPKEDPVPLFGPSMPPSSSKSGILGNIPQSYFTPDNVPQLKNGKMTFEKRPYYENVDSKGNYENIDNQLNQLFEELLKEFDSIYLEDTATDEEKLNYTFQAQKIISKLPYAVLLIDDISTSSFDYTIQAGTNRQLSALSSGLEDFSSDEAFSLPTFPPEGKRRLLQQAKLSQGFLKSSNELLSNYTLNQGLRIMPSKASTKVSLSIGSMIGDILYPFGVSFLLPVFVVTLVKEKEDRILMMMKMNGMNLNAYWFTQYILFYSLHIISTIIFIVTGRIFRLEFFTLTQPAVYLLFFFVWGNAQIGLAFAFSSFFSKSRPALLCVFCVVLAGVIVNIAIGSLLDEAPLVYLIWPPFAFYRAMSIMNTAAFDLNIPNLNISMLTPGSEICTCLIALVLETIILFLLSAYFNAVLPSEYGIQKPWHFIFSEPYNFFSSSNKKNENQEGTVEESNVKIDEEELEGEDDDVKLERERIYKGNHSSNSMIVMKDMRKEFPEDKVAVKNVTLAIDPDSVFGLLGPNGAGKTTLINILTGLYPPTSGDSRLAGYVVGVEMKDIYMNIGVCPQHDILWDDLTVEEHLLFYARIKGVSIKDEKGALNKALETVSLTNFRNRLSKGLSGGEKRRLSIAISLIGDPKVVFLDEPTTGLDPEVRRLIWNIINESKTGRTIILTTHSMEEAEVLCQRIAIMAKGTLRCLGPQVRLKNKYGSGFKLSFSCNPNDQERICRYIESILPSGFEMIDNFAGNCSYQFRAHNDLSDYLDYLKVDNQDSQDNQDNLTNQNNSPIARISNLFKEIGDHKDHYGIQFWGISQTSLEEVFLKIINDADSEA